VEVVHQFIIYVIAIPCRCDVIAMGIINAAQNIGMKKPIIIRLKGTNVEEAKKLIEVSSSVDSLLYCLILSSTG